MNIPVGTVEEQQISFVDSKPVEKLTQLMQSGFDGYLVATIEGISGLEEGLALVRGGQLVGSVFDALRLNKQFYGVTALRLVLNLLKAEKGVFDVNRLSKQQIDLIMAFNEKIRLPKTVDLKTLGKLEPAAYRAELVSEKLSVDLKASDSKHNILKKLGLGSI